MRITVYDVLGWLATGMSNDEIIDDFLELTETDMRGRFKRVASDTIGRYIDVNLRDF
jgi:uncharacterized protein (DUF433 family)